MSVAYEVIANNAASIPRQALEALKKIAEGPAAKIDFVDGDSKQPLPLMHMGVRAR